MALHRARQADSERFIESFNGRMRYELLSENLFFGLDQARSAISEWVDDYNTARTHSSRYYRTLAAFAEILTATGSDAALDRGFASAPLPNPRSTA